MADSVVLTRTCEALGLRTGLDGLVVRGAVRSALRETGLQAATVGVEQMIVVLRRVLPSALRACGVSDPEAVCRELESELRAVEGEPAEDPVTTAAAVFERFAPR